MRASPKLTVTNFYTLIILVVLLSVTSSASAALPETSPDKVGISPQRFKRVDDVLQNYVGQGRAAGIVTVISRHGQIVHESAVGTMGINDARPMQTDSLFRIMSMTKLVTAVAALTLYEEGRFQLYDSVSDYLPAFADMQVFDGESLKPAKHPVTIHQLFTHTAGLSYGFPPGHKVLDFIDKLSSEAVSATAYANNIAKLPLVAEPGSAWQYSFATDVLGALIEVISGQSLSDFLQDRVFGPLQMADTGYQIDAAKLGRLTTAHRWDTQQQEMAILSAPPFTAPYRYLPTDSGGAGLIERHLRPTP